MTVDLNNVPNEGPADFIQRRIDLRKKLLLTSKTSGEIEYDEVLVSGLSLKSMERGLESNLIVQKIRPVLRTEQGISLKDPIK